MALVEMKIILLGTAGAIPSSTRKLISTLVIRDGELFFFDTGEGVQQTLMNLKIGMNKSTRIFVTHMHGDHIFGLLGLIQTMSLLTRDKPLYVYGPLGIKNFLLNNIKNLGIVLNFSLVIQEIKEGLVIRTNEFKIYAKKGNHSRTKPNKEDNKDIKRAIVTLTKLSKYNFSQGAVVRNKKVIAIEGKGGTEKMLKKCKSKKFRNKGVLVKFPKKKQDLRIDLPTVGLKTLFQCKTAGLKGIVLQNKQNIFLEKKKMYQLCK